MVPRKRKPQDAVVSNVKRLRAEVKALEKRVTQQDGKFNYLEQRVIWLQKQVGA